MAVVTAIIVGAVIGAAGAIGGSMISAEASEDASYAAKELQASGLEAQRTAAEQERDWELEDRKYRELQQLEAEKRQLEYDKKRIEDTEAAIMRAEGRAEETTIRAEERAKEFIAKQQEIINKERDLLISMSEPFRQAVAGTIPELQGMLDEIKNTEESPLYKLRLEEGTKSVKEYYASIGLSASGAEGEELRKLSQQLTAEETDKLYGRQAQTIGLLQQAGAVGMGTIPQMPSAAAQSLSSGTIPQTQPSSMYAGGVPTVNVPGTGQAPNLAQGVTSLYQTGMQNIPYYRYAAGQNRANLYSGLANIGMSGVSAYARYRGQQSQQPSTGQLLYQTGGQQYSSQGVPSVMY